MASLVFSTFLPGNPVSSPLPLRRLKHFGGHVLIRKIESPQTNRTCYKKTVITNSIDCSSKGGPSEKGTPFESKTSTTMHINKIREILPHRFPFLLVDRVLEFTPGVSAVGIKNVSMNESFFVGHFPDRPIMPGVLMLEALAQLGALVLIDSCGGTSDKLAITGADNVKFRRHVVPGDTLMMTATLTKYQRRFRFAKMEGIAYVGDEVACECNITAVI